MRWLKDLGAAALVLGVVGCGPVNDRPPEAEPSLSYTGPEWEAYDAGREFGREHQDTARIPEGEALTTEPDGDIKDAVNADYGNARWWCQRNLPIDLESEHEEQAGSLLAGCVGGVFPMMDYPDLYAETIPTDDGR